MYNRNSLISTCVYSSVTLTSSLSHPKNKKVFKQIKSKHRGNAADQKWESKNANQFPKIDVAKHPLLAYILPARSKLHCASMGIAFAANIYATSSSKEKLRFLIPSTADHPRSSFDLPGLPKVHMYGKDPKPTINDHLLIYQNNRLVHMGVSFRMCLVIPSCSCIMTCLHVRVGACRGHCKYQREVIVPVQPLTKPHIQICMDLVRSW